MANPWTRLLRRERIKEKNKGLSHTEIAEKKPLLFCFKPLWALCETYLLPCMVGLWKDYRIWRAGALGWMALIFLLSSKSDVPVPSLFPLQDKIEHGIAFGILGFFFHGSFKPSWSPSFVKRVLVITAMVAAYGAFDELHQSLVPARDASLSDLAADTIGGIVSAIICSYKAAKRTVHSVQRTA